MSLTNEQLLAAHKANIEMLFGLTSKAFEGVEKLVELNLQVAKAAMGEVADHTRAVLSVKDAQELLALAEKILSGEVPPFCPHGRPCVLKLTRKELEKQFGRIV